MKLRVGLIVVGLVIALVGVLVYRSARQHLAQATLDNSFRRAMGNPFDDPSGAAHYVTLGHWGVGVLVFGLAVALIGVAAIAVRRS